MNLIYFINHHIIKFLCKLLRIKKVVSKETEYLTRAKHNKKRLEQSLARINKGIGEFHNLTEIDMGRVPPPPPRERLDYGYKITTSDKPLTGSWIKRLFNFLFGW